jgi:hypothetical protein
MSVRYLTQYFFVQDTEARPVPPPPVAADESVTLLATHAVGNAVAVKLVVVWEVRKRPERPPPTPPPPDGRPT